MNGCYLYMQVMDVNFITHTPERKAFREHLQKVAEALRAVELQDAEGGYFGENEKIRECLAQGAILDQLVSDARQLIEEMNYEITQLGLNNG